MPAKIIKRDDSFFEISIGVTIGMFLRWFNRIQTSHVAMCFLTGGLRLYTPFMNLFKRRLSFSVKTTFFLTMER